MAKLKWYMSAEKVGDTSDGRIKYNIKIKKIWVYWQAIKQLIPFLVDVLGWIAALFLFSYSTYMYHKDIILDSYIYFLTIILYLQFVHKK